MTNFKRRLFVLFLLIFCHFTPVRSQSMVEIHGNGPLGSVVTLFRQDTIVCRQRIQDDGKYSFKIKDGPERKFLTCNRVGFKSSGRIGISSGNVSSDFYLSPIKQPRKTVSAWISTPVFREGIESFANNASLFTHISPMAYRIVDNGRIHWNPDREVRSVQQVAYKHSVAVYPSLGADYKSPIVRDMIRNPEIRDRQIHRIAQQMLWFGFEGVDLDFEGIDPADRNDFTTFVRLLADTLHSYGLSLSVTLQPKLQTHGGQDYQAIGEAADIVRIMCYDNHWGKPIPPHHSDYTWIRNVMRFAISDSGGIPPEKVVMALPLYGHRGKVDGEHALFWTEVVDILKKAGLPESHVQRNVYDLPFFSIEDEAVYFEDGLSVRKKLDIIDELELQGVCFWRLGQEDPQLYRFMDDWLKGE
ncbi:glycosyl hydrolase family 18 protein [Fidelibacter multiformis]|jgi:spore germination protein YaaH|uniref:glycosyl hydrolase family 18 protein n=1 Tax=Fidelibacter multiformis TaxID=3377529 RepID=UPI0037DBF9DE